MNLRILFIGCVESSYRLLEGLLCERKEVAGVITKERSDFNADFMDLHLLCCRYGVPCRHVQDINGMDSVAFINGLRPDIGFCFGWSQLLGEEVISLFPKGVVGFHPAALPDNRGRHPLIWALALGLHETASTFFMINTDADRGDIVSQERVPIDYADNARTLYDKVMNVAVGQEMGLISDFENGTVSRVAQKNGGNLWRKRSKPDGQIDWRMSSKGIYNLVRSLSRPYPGAHFIFRGNEYKVWEAQEIGTWGLENIEPGKVLKVYGDGRVDVKTGEGGIRLLDVDGFIIKEGDYII